MPRPYPPEFRQRALALVRSGRPVPEVAKLLGIAESCRYRWKRQDLINRGLKPATGRGESAELVAARQKIRDLEEENKILRKAAAAVQEVVPQKERFRLVTELHADGIRLRRARYARGVHVRLLRVEDRAPPALSVRHAWLTDMIGAGPRGVLWHQRPAEGPRPAAAQPRPGGRAQHRDAADAARRTFILA